MFRSRHEEVLYKKDDLHLRLKTSKILCSSSYLVKLQFATFLKIKFLEDIFQGLV